MEKLSDHIIEGNSLMAKFMGFQITKEPEEYNYKYSYWEPGGILEKYSFFGVLHSENYEQKFLQVKEKPVFCFVICGMHLKKQYDPNLFHTLFYHLYR